MFFIGVVFALWVISAQMLLPLCRHLVFVLRSPRLTQRRGRAAGVTVFALGTLGAVLVLGPVPASTSALGVIRFPAGAEVRAGADGIVTRLAVTDGAMIAAGAPIVVLEDPFLDAEFKRARWRAEELERLHSQARMEDPLQAQQVAAARDKARAEFADVAARVQRLVVRSPASGIVHIAQADSLPGRFIAHGDVLAMLSVSGQPLARVVVPQSDATLLRERTVAVQVRVEGALDRILDAEVQREVPAATDRLPSRALGSRGGGQISVDSRDDDGTRSLAQVFELELALPGDALEYRPGTRVHVRFVHAAQPLAARWYRRLRQLFLSRFQV
jgi:putative peptide zinc metalloprotease protein